MTAIKHLHMVLGLLTVLLFVIQAGWLLMRQDRQLPARAQRFFRMMPHILYAVVIGLGIWLMVTMMRVGVNPLWVHPKIVLFLIAIVGTAIAMRPGASRGRQNLGLLIAGLCYIGILYSVIAKPLGYRYAAPAVAATAVMPS